MKNNKQAREERKRKKGHEPNDGTFISYKDSEEFNMDGSARYGAEQDSCDA